MGLVVLNMSNWSSTFPHFYTDGGEGRVLSPFVLSCRKNEKFIVLLATGNPTFVGSCILVNIGLPYSPILAIFTMEQPCGLVAVLSFAGENR